MRKRRMSEAVFDRKYKPIIPRGGCETRNYDELDPRYEDPSHVWSVVEEDDVWSLLPGYHVVNVIGYVQTRRPWGDKEDKEGLVVKYD